VTAVEAGPGVAEVTRRLARAGRIYDLSHPISPSTPVFPFHVRYAIALHRRHGDTTRPGGSSFANELLVMPGHLSTHIDAIGHFSRGGRVHGGRDAGEIQGHEGLTALDAAALPLLWRRGVLLDVAGGRGTRVLPAGAPIDADELRDAGPAPEPGDVVLVRTGWSAHWDDPDRFNGRADGYPGVSPDGARWLIERGAGVVGSDTPAFEVAPPVGDSVHAMLLVDAGIPIIENLALDELAADGGGEFLFVALPLRLEGATGSPIRPIALV
jgi:kynurenine formamidase